MFYKFFAGSLIIGAIVMLLAFFLLPQFFSLSKTEKIIEPIVIFLLLYFIIIWIIFRFHKAKNPEKYKGGEYIPNKKVSLDEAFSKERILADTKPMNIKKGLIENFIILFIIVIILVYISINHPEVYDSIVDFFKK